MADKVIKTRVVHKHDIALNWAKAKNFVPEKGELIIFDADSQEDIDRGFYTEYPLKTSYINGVAYKLVPSAYVRFKIGNGSDNVNVLPFYLTREGVTSLTSGAVKYDQEDQGLQSYQKYYARNNIDAGLSPFVIYINANDDGTFRSSKTYDEIIEASNNFYGPGERPIICYWEGFRAEPLFKIDRLNPIEFLISLDGLSYFIHIGRDEEGNTTVDVIETFQSITIGSETWDLDNPEVDFTASVNELIDNKNKVLVVEVADGGSGYQCTHTPQQIYEHIQNGGVVVVREGPLEYRLLECQTDYADFYTITDDFIFRLLSINTTRTTASENQLTTSSDVKPLIVTYNTETNTATYTASQIYEHISNGSTALLYNPEDSHLYPIGMCDGTSAIFSGPITGEWELFLTRFYIDNEAKVQTYDTQLVCHYEFENESKPFMVSINDEDNTLSENYETIAATIESGRIVILYDKSGYYYYLESFYNSTSDITFGAFDDEGYYRHTVRVGTDSSIYRGSYKINLSREISNLSSEVQDISKVVTVDESTNETYVSASHLSVNSVDDFAGVSFEVGELEQSSDNPVQVLELYGTAGDEPVRLRRIAPGTQDDDAVTLAQLNEATDIIPIEHSWNGTVLTIRSNSGESSMDLQGADGDNGCGIFGYAHEIDPDSPFITNVVYSHILYPAGRVPIVGDIVIGTNGQLAAVYSITSAERVILSNLGINIKGDPGNEGEDGNSIAGITKTSSEGLVDTYTVSFTNGETYNFTVTNGSDGAKGDQGFGIVASVERPSFTEAKWNEYGTIGDEETWSNTSDIRNGCRVGDLFMVCGTATDTGNSHTLYFRNSSTSGNLGGVCIAHSVAKGGQKGDPGAPGNDGVGILSIEKESSSGLTDTYVINFTDGSSTTFLVKNGEKGKDGTPGVGIESVVQTVTSPDSGGTNKITVTKTDGTTSTFVIKNGEKGDNGDSITVSHITESTTNTGVKTHTVQFSDGSSFTLLDGVSIQSIVQTVTSTEDKGTNTITITNTDGTTSSFNILNGSKGSKGDKGDTPVKGVDYFTENDIQEIVQDVKDALPVDSEKSTTSTNPLQNKVITQEITRLENGIQTALEGTEAATSEAQRALNTANAAGQTASMVSGRVENIITPRIDALEKDVAKNSFENFPASNLLNFYDPSLIDVSYCNPKNLPGWQVRFNDSGVYDKSNEFFSGAEGMSEHKEITFKPAGTIIDIGIQTASTAHHNSCKISNLSLVRTDGQSLGHLDSQSLPTFCGDTTEVVHNDTFSDGTVSGWSNTKGVGDECGRVGTPGLCLEATGWNGAGNKTFTVTPGILHTVSFYYKANRNGLNVKICDGTSSSDTKLASGYLSGTSWTLASYTFIPTGNNIFVNFNGSNLGTADAPDSVWIDDFTVSKATGFTLWDGIIKNTSSNGQFYVTMDVDTLSIRMRSNWSYWNEYVKIPLTGLNPEDTYVLRFAADVVSNGVNLSGENITWITRDKSYIASDGYYIASFQPSSTGPCYITFKGDGQSKDDVTISDIHIFNQNEPIGTLGLDNKRWISDGLSEWQDNSLVLQGNGKTYSYGLRTLAIAVSPDVEYKLSFDIEYDKPNTYNWMPYITLTDEDKISLVTDSCIPTECPQCGGPWIGDTDSAHTLKIDIDIPNLPSKINPSMLQFVLGSDDGVAAATAEVTLYSQPDNTVISTTSYNLIEEVDYSPGDVVCQVPIEADYTISGLSVVIIPDMTPALEGLLGNIRVRNLKLFANRRITDLPEQIKSSMPYYSGPNKEMIFYSKITAPLFEGKIDDGSLD